MIVIRKIFNITLFLASILIVTSCFKQEPKKIENNDEIIQVERLNACTRMNLFDDLFSYENIKATFTCTQWNKNFTKLFAQIEQTPSKSWNHLLRPVSVEILDNKENLKRLIAVSQELDKKGGLVDLGNVIGALSDTNFYDGLNNLFRCSEEDCEERVKVSRKDILSLMNIIKVLKDENVKIHSLLAHSLKNLQLLRSGFSEDFSNVLNSKEFKSNRMSMIDLLISVIAIEKNEFELIILPKLLEASEESTDSIWAWINSNNFSANLLKDLIKFNTDHPNAINDLRSISQIKQQKLACSDGVTASFFVNLEKHLRDLVEVFATKENEEIGKYLESDLAQHQIASQACPNFKEINVTLDNIEHKLSVIRLKKSLIEFIRIPGVLSLVKSVSKILDSEEGFTEQVVSNLLNKYSDKNYLGSLESFVRIINEVSPEILNDYVKFLKGMPVSAFNDLSHVLSYILTKENHKAWQSFGKAWTFFNEKEKEFLFNYIDKHFSRNSNYMALFNYYLELYTIAQPSLDSLIEAWIAKDKVEMTYSSLKDVAWAMNGEEVLSDFRRFFSREHMVKIIELFVNGETLTAWAQEISALIPRVSINNISFNFNDAFSGNSNSCLNSIVSTDLDILIKSFPESCTLTDGATLIGKLSLLSGLSKDFALEQGYGLIGNNNFLNYKFLQSLILTIKKSSLSLKSENELSSLLKFQNDKLLSDDAFDLAVKLNEYINSLPPEDQIVLKSRSLKELSSLLSDEKSLDSLSEIIKKVALVHQNQQWEGYKHPSLPEQINSSGCLQTLNLNIGGSPCPSKKIFKEFISTFSKLMIRKNDDESPLGARQFLKALDQSEGLPIPLGAREPQYKNLSIKESLEMFIDFSDIRKPINVKMMEYESNDSTIDQKTTLMERVEVVIRDVNFDENYLGAHYKNSVAKSYVYNDVVESKYKLFNVCVKAGFCGKFMNRSEKKLARNAVRAFPSLLEANQGEFQYGDYMKALLGAVVSSSSKASQISTMLKFKKNGDGFNIPWIQTKKQLRKHNGKILSEIAEISGFSNMARWTRDRFARSDKSFEDFLKSKKLNLINENLFKNLNDQVSDKSLEDLFSALSESDQLWDDIFSTVESLDYKKLRHLEAMAGDILVIASTLSKNDVNINYDKAIELLAWTVRNYEAFKNSWPANTSIVDIVLEVSPYVSIISSEIINSNQLISNLATLLASKLNLLMFNESDRVSFFEILKSNNSAQQAKILTEIVIKTNKYLTNFSDSQDKDYYKNLNAISNTLSIDNLGGFNDYLTMSVNSRVCEQRGELVYCKENQHYLEPWKIVDYFAGDKARWNKYLKGLVNPPDDVSAWLFKSLSLINLTESKSGD